MTEDNVRNNVITVGTTALVVAEELRLANRSFISFVNTSTSGQVITLSLSQQAGAGKGIPLSPGGFFSESRDSNVFPSNLQWTAISSAAGGLLSIQERTQRKGDA